MVKSYGRRAGATSVDHFESETHNTDNLAIVNADGSTIDGDDIIGYPASATNISPGFDTWTQADPDRPTQIFWEVRSETDGANPGEIQLQVDETGGTTASDEPRIAWADPGLGSGGRDVTGGTWFLPAGAQFKVFNRTDPAGGNAIDSFHKVIL